MQLLYSLPLPFGDIIKNKRAILEREISEKTDEIEAKRRIADNKTKPEAERDIARLKWQGLELEIEKLNGEIEKEEVKKENRFCNLRKSIAQKIHLILMTHFGEYRYDYYFGSSLWEHDFEMLSNFDKWRDEIVVSVKQTLDKNETRLTGIDVKVNIDQEEFTNENATQQKVKLRIGFVINANIREINQPFDFKTRLYVSPISVD